MTDALRSGPASVAHGVGCVSLALNGHGSASAVALTPDDADRLADLLHEQAQHARDAAADAMWAHTEGVEP
jgi:hypothetical protein